LLIGNIESLAGKVQTNKSLQTIASSISNFFHVTFRHTVALAQVCEIRTGKTRCVDYSAFVDGFGNGQILIVSPCGDQNTTLGTTRLYDCVVARIGLVKKPQRLAGRHLPSISKRQTVRRLL
jgi:hypothetical protein